MAIESLDGALASLVFFLRETEAVSTISLRLRAKGSGNEMLKAETRQILMLSEADEAALRSAIANDPANPELTDDRLAALRPAAKRLRTG